MPAYRRLIKFTRFVLHRITSSCQILSVWCFNVSYPAVPSWNIYVRHLSKTQHAVRGFHVDHLSLLRVYIYYIPIGSMYGIYGIIYHQYTPNVSIYIPYMDPMGYGSDNGHWSTYNKFESSSRHRAIKPSSQTSRNFSHPFPIP